MQSETFGIHGISGNFGSTKLDEGFQWVKAGQQALDITVGYRLADLRETLVICVH